MKLYNLDHSPYSTRVRILLRKKGLPVEVCPPPVPLRTAEFYEKFPLGKLPVLELDDERFIGESSAIMDYLEDVSEAPSFRPVDPFERAQMQEMIRYGDTHLSPNALFPIFQQLFVPGEKDWKKPMEALDVEMNKLVRLLGSHPHYAARGLHLGDMALVPMIGYIFLVSPAMGVDNPLEAYPKVQAWWDWTQQDEVVAETTQEMYAAFKVFMASMKK